MPEQQTILTGASVLNAVVLILTGAVGGAVVGAIGKLVVDRKLQTQKHEYNKKLKVLELKLEKKNTVHKFQFEKEFQLYCELWKALVAVRQTAVFGTTIDRMPKDKSSFDDYVEKLNIAVDAFNKAKNLFEDHRPFYHDKVSETTKDMLSECRGYMEDVRRMLRRGKETVDLCDEADKLLKKVPEAIDKIEKVIKLRIGLLQEAEIA